MKLIKRTLIIAICLTIGISCFSQTQGTLSVSVTTSTTGGNYAPRHILAIWIEKEDGTFVKTRLLRSQTQKYRPYLTQFKAATNSTYNTTDATTDATLSSHGTRTVTWDATDVNGSLVPDGNYKVCVEFTENNYSGPYQTYTFTKSSQGQTLTPTDASNVKNVSITWTPASSLLSVANNSKKLAVYPNPIKDYALISLDKNVKNAYVTDVKGNIVARINLSKNMQGNKIVWNPSKSLKNGVYFVVTETSTIKKSTQVVISR